MSRILVIGLAASMIALPGCTGQAASPPYKPASNVLQLMEGPLAHAAEDYWDAVQTVIDETGMHEHFPKDDEEWEHVWASALTIAESGNLLMMPSRARDNGDWMKFASELVDVGMEAAKAAESKDREQVLDAGGRVYLVCTRCHMKYIPEE